MQSESERDRMRNRGLLTREDRKVLRGGKDVDEDRLHDIRWNINKRIERIETDLEILEEAGEGDLVNDFYDEFGMSDLARRVRELEKEAKNGRDTRD